MIDSRCPYCATLNTMTIEEIRPIMSEMVTCSCCGGFYKVTAHVTFTTRVTPVNQNQGSNP